MQALYGREILTDKRALVCRLSHNATPGTVLEAGARYTTSMYRNFERGTGLGWGGRDKGRRQVGMSPGKEQTSQQPYLPVRLLDRQVHDSASAP